MIGIEAGATGIVLSTGERVDFDPAGTPEDLLLRIARGEPYVRVVDGRSQIYDSVELYVSMITGAIHERNITGTIALAVPGWWPSFAASEVSLALSEHGVTAVLVNSAEAAVAGYRDTHHQLPDNTAVLSLRSQLTSVVVVRDCGARPRAVPSPKLVRNEGGKHLDAAVLRHLVRGLGNLGEDIDATRPETIRAAREALEQCRNLREALSRNATGAVQPRLPGTTHKLLLVRSELDELVEPWVESMLRMVRTAIDQSDGDVDAVLLAGGLAAMPLVSQRVSADLAVEVHMPDDLRLFVARGAALLAFPPQRRATGLRGMLRMLKPGPADHSPTESTSRGSIQPRVSLTLVQQ